MSQTTETSALQAPPQPQPQPQHRWLQKLVGEWTYGFNDPGGPGRPATTATGTETVRKVGDLWVVAEAAGDMPGAGFQTSLMTLGFDPGKGRFVGTWIGSMMHDLWIYDGELDATGRILTLDSEGPSMKGDGTRGRYQDVIEFKSDDHRTLTGRTLTDDGAWQEFMKMDFRRRK